VGTRHPAAPGDVDPVTLSVRLAGAVPAGFVSRAREIGAEIDPALQLHDVGLLADRYQQGRSAWRWLAWAIALVTASVLLLSAAGSYVGPAPRRAFVVTHLEARRIRARPPRGPRCPRLALSSTHAMCFSC
jgi:hypothetical protein